MRTPRSAALAGVLFALLFGAVEILIRTADLDGDRTQMRVAAVLMPFAGIAFLWFIGVVRDGFGGFEDKFFSTVFVGSGLLFLALMFVASAVGIAAGHSSGEAAAFGHALATALSKTYALRMAAVFMISLATIWLKTGLMPRWLVIATYLAAVGLLVAAEVSMWLTLAFPLWVLVVSVLLLVASRSAAEPVPEAPAA
ncbi:hypothetical protein A5663_03575 [Mycobacterium sp. E740]|nr:hypothetical protein [Mycobacterium sp. E740]OBI76140.1 hypothetical protein A5663_03575 [Mycobacterium sp. E740]